MVLNPVVLLRTSRDKKREAEEASKASVSLFEERIKHSAFSVNRKERDKLTELLKEKGVSAEDLGILSELFSKNYGRYLILEKRKIKECLGKRRLHTLKDVVGISPFSKLLVIMRELYAEDIAKKILYDDAVAVIVAIIFLGGVK
jgi:hypothetical protein